MNKFEIKLDFTHKAGMKFADKPYDEAFEISQDLSVAESYDGRDKVSEIPSFSSPSPFFFFFFSPVIFINFAEAART